MNRVFAVLQEHAGHLAENERIAGVYPLIVGPPDDPTSRFWAAYPDDVAFPDPGYALVVSYKDDGPMRTFEDGIADTLALRTLDLRIRDQTGLAPARMTWYQEGAIAVLYWKDPTTPSAKLATMAQAT